MTLNTPPYHTTIHGQEKGPKTIVLGGVHGNETVGIDVIKKLEKTLSPENICGSLTLIFGNPEANKQDKRFIDIDLNRLMSEEILAQSAAKSSLNNEEKRSVEIAPLFESVDYLLDLHATIKPSVGFCYSDNTEQHHALCSFFDVAYVLSPEEPHITSTMSTCFDNYADALGGIGLTLEAGWLKDDSLLGTTYDSVINYLSYIGTLKQTATPPNKPQKKLLIYKELIAKTDDFAFTFDIKNFDKLEPGKVFATDGGEEITVERESYMIFPKTIFKAGVETGYLAYEG